MVASVYSVQSLPLLFSRRSCCLALRSLIIAFDRVVALFSCQAGFLHVLYKLKDGDAVNSSGVSVSQEGRLEAEPSQSLIFLLAVLWRGCRKVWEEQKSKQVSGLEVRLKGAGRFTAAVGGHNPLQGAGSSSLCFNPKQRRENTVYNRTLFFLHWKQFPLMG